MFKRKERAKCDSSMAQSLSEVSGSMDGLDTSDEGKKIKSRFKVLWCFLAKKEEDKTETIQAETMRRITPSPSKDNVTNTSLKEVQATKPSEIRSKTSMETKAKSHESIIHMDPNLERPSSKMSSSPEAQRGRAQQSSSETSSGLIKSPSLTTITSPSGNVMSVDFSTPATAQGCLDSAAAQHKMTLKPRKQNIKKSPQETHKPKYKEPSFPLVCDNEKNRTQPKEMDPKKAIEDTAGFLSHEQSKTPEIFDKTAKKGADTDPGSQGSKSSEILGRHGKRKSSTSGMSETGPRGSRVRQLCRNYDPNYLAEKAAGEYLPSKKQVAEQPTIPQAEATTPQEWRSDKHGTRKAYASTDRKVKKASAPQYAPEEAGKPIPSAEAEEFADLCLIQSEGAVASSVYSKSAMFKMKLTQDIPKICKEKSIKGLPSALKESAVSPASTKAEKGISKDRLRPRNFPQALGKPEADKQISLSESDSKEQVALGKSRYEQEISESKSLVVDSSGSRQQMARRHSVQVLGKLSDEQEEAASESENADVGTDLKGQLPPGHSFQSWKKPKDGRRVVSKSEAYVLTVGDKKKKPGPRWPYQPLKKPENENVATGSNSDIKKYRSTEGCSSYEEDLPPRNPLQASGERKDEREVTSISMEQQPPEQPSQSWMKQVKQPTPASVRSSAKWGGSTELKSSGSAPLQQLGPERNTKWDTPTESQPPEVSPRDSKKDKRTQWVLPESVAAEEIVSPKPKIVRQPSKLSKRPFVEQGVFVGTEVTAVQGNIAMQADEPLVTPVAESAAVIEERISMKLMSLKQKAQSQVKPTVKPQVSLGPECPVVEQSISKGPLPAKQVSKSWANLEVEGKLFSKAEGITEPSPPKYSTKPTTKSKSQQIFSKSSTVVEDIFMKKLPPGRSYQSLMKTKSQPHIVTQDSASTSAEWKVSAETLFSRQSLWAWAKAKFDQTPESPKTAVKKQVKPKDKQEVSGTVSASKPKVKQEDVVSTCVQSVLQRRGSSPSQADPKIEQQVCAGHESDAVKGQSTMEQPPPKSITKEKVQQISLRFENAAVKGGIFGKPDPSRQPAQLLKKSNVQEISSHLEKIIVQDQKKSQFSKVAPQPIVKFMAQQLFSGQARPPTDPSKSAPKPTVEHQDISSTESVNTREAHPGKQMSVKHPSSRKPKDQLPGSENTLEKRRRFKEPLPARYLFLALDKLEQEASVARIFPANTREGHPGKQMSVKHPSSGKPKDQLPGSENTLEKRRRFKEPLPACQLFLALDKLEQEASVARIFPVNTREGHPGKQMSVKHPSLGKPKDQLPGSENTLEKRKHFKEPLPARQLFLALDKLEQEASVARIFPKEQKRSARQALGDTSEKKPVPSSSMIATTKKTILQSGPRSPPLAKGPVVSPDKTKKQGQSSKDLNKNTSAIAPKLVKFLSAAAQPTSISGALYAKKEVLERDDQDEDKPASSLTVGIENLFGVKLRKVPSAGQQYKNKKGKGLVQLQKVPSGSTPVSAWKEEQFKRITSSHLPLGTPAYLPKTSSVAEKSKYEATIKKESYKIQDKGLSRQQSVRATLEPTWVTISKLRQATPFHSFHSHAFEKDLNIKKEPYLERKNQQRSFISNVFFQQERMTVTQPPKSTKEVEKQKVPPVIVKKKEALKLVTLPATPKKHAKPAEPDWLSMAKEKSKAWSYIADFMK